MRRATFWMYSSQAGSMLPPLPDSNDPWEPAPALQPVWWRGDQKLQMAEFLKSAKPNSR